MLRGKAMQLNHIGKCISSAGTCVPTVHAHAIPMD